MTWPKSLAAPTSSKSTPTSNVPSVFSAAPRFLSFDEPASGKACVRASRWTPLKKCFYPASNDKENHNIIESCRHPHDPAAAHAKYLTSRFGLTPPP